MAANHTHQSRVEESFHQAPRSSDRIMQQTPRGVDCLMEARGRSTPANLGPTGLQPYEMPNDSKRRFNEVQLISNRRIRFNQKERRQLELLCEDKVSKHKFEEVHCSIPSSIKSTIIMTFSPDGQRVASSHGDHRIYICDLNTGKLLDTLEGHPKTPWCLTWHPRNKDILASGCLAGEVRVWDLRSKACESWTSENHGIISSLDFHPRERILVIATLNDILFWDWSESDPYAKATTMHEREKVKFVVFDSSGTRLITGISNLPKYAGFSTDSLQNRIIDGYLSQGTIENLPTESMTHSSEMTASSSSAPNANASHVGHNNINFMSPNSRSRVVGGATEGSDGDQEGEYDINYQNTVLLSRVATLYRHLESLEDSMRHTSFAPIVNVRPVESSASTGSADEITRSESLYRNGPPNSESNNNQLQNQEPIPAGSTRSHSPPTSEAPSQNWHESTPQPLPTTQLASTFEPYLVTFDELLEQLQLPTLIMDGRSVDLATVIDQYPVDLSRQVHHAMQFESINQVNQNFIRISKLLSSARVYRQLVQQINSFTEGNRPYPPNQALSAQSVSPRSPRHSPNVPLVLRNYALANGIETGDPNRDHRSNDPIVAIEFRNAARNVPLTSICKIELLAARTICILRAQTLVDQAIANARPLTSSDQQDSGEGLVDSSRRRWTSRIAALLSDLHVTLGIINHAPLTTSNAYSHITTLRVKVERLLIALNSSLRSPTDGQRLGQLMHEIAFSLTGRSWSLPLGATLNEIRLDTINVLCIVDLALHLVRQIQLLHMTRVSLIARVEESRQPSAASQASNDEQQLTARESNAAQTSSEGPSGSTSGLRGASKRKSSGLKNESKRLRTTSSQSNTDSDSFMDAEEARSNVSSQPTDTGEISIVNALGGQPISPERMAIWNSPQNQIEQGLQRFFLAAAPPGISTSHILVRVYHRLHGMAPYPPLADTLGLERTSPSVERRRALSQDNTTVHLDPAPTLQNGVNPPTQPRHRVRPPAIRQIINLPHGSNQHPPIGLQSFDPWQRSSHVRVIHTHAPGQHLWFPHAMTIPVQMNNSNFRLQCWNFSKSLLPDIKDSQMNVITHKCRLHNDASVDLSSDGSLLACLVPREDGPSCLPPIELKIFSLKSHDFGSCYYRLMQCSNALSVSLSPSGNYAVVGLLTQKNFNYESNEDDLKIGRVFKLCDKNSIELVRDIKIKRDDTSNCLNAIKWMPRGIVYSVGPQHMQRYQAQARMRNVVGS